MTIVAVAGDVCTSTTVAIASNWPAGREVVVLEADPSGGDLAAWFDLPVAPSLSTVVTRLTDAGWSDLERFVRTAGNGLRLIPGPARAAEAQQALGEAARTLVPSLAAMRGPVFVVDTGPVLQPPGHHPFVGAAHVTVVVHRQASQSARAAAARLQRFADTLEGFASVAANVVVAIVGSAPFSPDEIQAFLAGSVGATPVTGLPVDELTAGVYAGRTGVSPRRLARLPLTRAASDLAAAAAAAVDRQTVGLWKVPT